MSKFFRNARFGTGANQPKFTLPQTLFKTEGYFGGVERTSKILRSLTVSGDQMVLHKFPDSVPSPSYLLIQSCFKVLRETWPKSVD